MNKLDDGPAPLNWTPLMDSVVDSSLWTEPYFVRVLFITMLALKGRDMVVRRSAFAIAQRAHMSEREVLDGLKILSSPDKKRLEAQAHEGRRVERQSDGGWLILNGAYYRNMITKVQRRVAKTQWQAAARERQRNFGHVKKTSEAMGERILAGESDPVAGNGGSI